MAERIEVQILADRVREVLPAECVTAKRMFGGITFLLNGNMLCCASKQGLMVRVGKDAEPQALSRPFASRCLGAGRPMAGFIMVEHEGIANSATLQEWLKMARHYVEALPPAPTYAKRPE
jgi:TfoX/Sxy family transcriptional regulator of competence genes